MARAIEIPVNIEYTPKALRVVQRQEWSAYAEAAVSNLSDAADPHLAAQRAIVIADALLAAADARFCEAAPAPETAEVRPPLGWTAERPTVPGWYFIGGIGVETAPIEVTADADGALRGWVGDGTTEPIAARYWADHLWCGPIQLPTLPEETR